jgi:hypothetical protein
MDSALAHTLRNHGVGLPQVRIPKGGFETPAVACLAHPPYFRLLSLIYSASVRLATLIMSLNLPVSVVANLYRH